MEKNIFYHAVTERPMELGQTIIFSNEKKNGVAERVDRVQKIIKENDEIDLDKLDDLDKVILSDKERWTNIAERELALEKVRIEKYPNYPSRMASLYVSRDLEDAKRWARFFIDVGRKTFQVVKLECRGNSFTGDAHNCWYECPSEEEAEGRADHYWNNRTNSKGETPILETIIDGEIRVVEIIEDFI